MACRAARAGRCLCKAFMGIARRTQIGALASLPHPRALVNREGQVLALAFRHEMQKSASLLGAGGAAIGAPECEIDSRKDPQKAQGLGLNARFRGHSPTSRGRGRPPASGSHGMGQTGPGS